MEKAKLILISLATLAVAGGAVAFNLQNSFGGNLQCTFVAPPIGQEHICPIKTYDTEGTTPAWCKPLNAANEVKCTFTLVGEHP